MKACPFCKEEIKDNATFCPHCHQRLVRRKGWGLVIAGIIFLFMASALLTQEPTQSELAQLSELEKEIKDLTLYIAFFQFGGWGLIIIGAINLFFKKPR